VGGTGAGACLVALLARRLLVVLASLALLGSGAAELLPRSAVAALSAPTASSTPPAGARSEMQAPARALLVRGPQLAVVPGQTGSGAALPPATGPHVAPHLVADPQSRPPAASRHGLAPGAPGSRAPPHRAGT
jgi:hypothetical protein